MLLTLDIQTYYNNFSSNNFCDFLFLNIKMSEYLEQF